ncbi:MAG: cytochrome b/b6 domain-containing protein [Beijerinckiaceae bacterium]
MSGSTNAVLAWDGPTRAFKWALVVLVVDGWVSNKLGASVPGWHKWNGYAVLTLIVFRILWGFAGGSTARFANFVAGPSRALAYLRGGVSYLGHNPVGGWMILGLMALIAAQCLTGLYAGDEDRVVIEGPLARTVADATVEFAARWHHRAFDLLKIVVVLHIAANLFYTYVKRDPLIPAMVTGRKPPLPYADMKQAQPGSWGRAAICLALAAAIVFGGIYAAGGRVF